MNTTIKQIADEYAKPYLVSLFNDEKVAKSATTRLTVMLELLPSEISVAVLAYCKKNGFDGNIGHDLNGLYNEDRCFLPRIKALQRFAK
jgi:hypothetical protein